MIILVAAMTKDRVIGVDDSIPWHIPEEIRHYRSIVSAGTVVMGGGTYRLMKNSLPGKHNIAISKSLGITRGIDVCGSVEDALQKAGSYGDDVFVVGGQSIFEQTIGSADMMELSFIKKDYQGNKFFPQFNPNEWKVEREEDFPDFKFTVYSRKRIQ